MLSRGWIARQSDSAAISTCSDRLERRAGNRQDPGESGTGKRLTGHEVIPLTGFVAQIGNWTQQEGRDS